MAKERIFSAQTAGDFLVLNADNARAAAAAARSAATVCWFFSRRARSPGAWVQDGWVVFRPAGSAVLEPIVDLQNIPLKGAHNVENVLAAVCAAWLAGARAETIAKAVRGFRAVEHRLEYVATDNGVDYYNDSKATNVDASSKAIAAFPAASTSSSAARTRTQTTPISRTCFAAGSRRSTPSARRQPRSNPSCAASFRSPPATTLERAVARCPRCGSPGDVVLLSPACSSFDQFENYEHRGRVFKELVFEHVGAKGAR